MVADLVRTRGWDQGYQPLDQLERFEHDVGRTVAPAVPEPVGEIPVGEGGEALGGDGRPGHVATESLEARAVPRRDADARVQANARHARTERSGNAPERFGVDPIAKPPNTPAGSFSSGHAALHRCSGELGHQRSLVREGVGIRGISIEQTPPGEQPLDAAGGARHHALDLGVVRGRERREANGSASCRPVHAVKHHGVEVDVQVQRVTKALHEGDCAALHAATALGPALAATASQRCEHRTDEHAEHRARELPVISEAVAQPEGQREHPLADGDHGQHAID